MYIKSYIYQLETNCSNHENITATNILLASICSSTRKKHAKKNINCVTIGKIYLTHFYYSDTIIMGDLNEHIGSDKVRDVVGKFSIGSMNKERGIAHIFVYAKQDCHYDFLLLPSRIPHVHLVEVQLDPGHA